MKNVLLFFSFFLAVTACRAQASKSPAVALIPEPVSVQTKTGSFVLPKAITIQAPSGTEMGATVALLKERLSVPTGHTVTVSSSAPAAAIKLQLNQTADAGIDNEGYRLSVTPKAITIKANKPAGLFYGVQTLVQLFPKEIENKTVQAGVKWEAPAVEITDYPRFGWRGLMFDVSRHFFTKQEVKNFIDNMVRYKYNLLHWHLTDDEGWRIEIEGLPKLTKVGAWNVKKEGYFGTFSPPTPDEPRTYGGFYTQDDIREVVQYAKERFVDVLPEVDVPGHSLAAIAAYAELSCTEGADKYVVRSGEPIMDWSRGAPPIAFVDNTLCPANEKVYEFMDKVVTQLAKLFPFEYIHLGGDEAPHNFWEKNAQVKALMEREGLKTIPQVQEYFTRRVEKIVAAKGKKLIGWDEILEGGDLPKTTAVMSWRGMKHGTEAAKKGHEVVMSPTTYAYIDYMQGDPIIEPRIYASLRLSKSYQFDPLPEGVDKKFIKGGQANLWTEQVYNMRHAEYMVWPRGWAIAESVWSPKAKKNWKDFFGRVEKHFARFDEADINYAPSVYDPIFKVTKRADSTLKIELGTEVDNLAIHYSFDNTFPDHHALKYTGALTPPKDAVQLRVITYRGREKKGRMNTMPIEELKKRADAKRNYE
ncbi:family 20 glycosylhydrolase [Flavisolibacter sp. BT320]|nr:family 20 glycosylhydrolase [Flavisolibacter longurius]